MDRALQRNSRTNVFLMARGKHPVGVPKVPQCGGRDRDTLWRQVQVAALIGLMLGAGARWCLVRLGTCPQEHPWRCDREAKNWTLALRA
jgi:hypothetical protein